MSREINKREQFRGISLSTRTRSTYADVRGNIFLAKKQSQLAPPAPDVGFDGVVLVYQTTSFGATATATYQTPSINTLGATPAPFADNRTAINWNIPDNLRDVQIEKWNKSTKVWEVIDNLYEGSPGYYVLDYYQSYRVKLTTINAAGIEQVFSLDTVFSGGAPDTHGDVSVLGAQINPNIIQVEPTLPGVTTVKYRGVSLTQTSQPVSVPESVQVWNSVDASAISTGFTTTKYRGLVKTNDDLVNPVPDATNVWNSVNASAVTGGITVTRFNGISIS